MHECTKGRKKEIMNKISINSANSKLHGFARSRVRAFVHSFRFRRWSRASYAVFRSLSLCVTIGKLSNDICEKAFYKLKGVVQKILAFVSLENDFVEENTEPNEFIRQNQLEQILVNYTFNSSVAASDVVAVLGLAQKNANDAKSANLRKSNIDFNKRKFALFASFAFKNNNL